MDEKEAERIRKEAKQILDRFGKTLESVKFKEKVEKKEVGGFREEGQGRKGDEEFRRAMFNNAPNKNSDNIIAEKKKW
jgi:hypothetical protein